MEEHPPVGGDTAWVCRIMICDMQDVLTIQVSQYGLYDSLSKAYQSFLDGLHAVHTSRLQCRNFFLVLTSK